MEDKKHHKYKGKSTSIVEKYKYLKFQTYTTREFISLVKELVNLQEQNEKLISKQEHQLKNKEIEIDNLKEKLAVFYSTDDNLQKYVGYNVDWLYVDKIVFALERSQKPLNSHQIVDILIRIEPTLKQKLLDPFNSITKRIYTGVKLNRITRHNKTGNFGYTYILPNWLDERGNVVI